MYKKFNKIYINFNKLINVLFIKKIRYYIFLINQIIFRIWYFIYKYKNKILKLFRDWKKKIKIQINYKIKIVRINNNDKFINIEF